MASRRSSKRKVGIEEIKEGMMEQEDFSEKEEELVVETYETPIYNKVKIQSRISARVVVSGDRTVSGKRYEWKRSGDIVEVDKEDAPGLLEKRLGDKTCCGASPDNLKVFILVE